MIIDSLLTLVIKIGTFFSSFFQPVTLSDFPFVGEFISSTLLFMVTTWNAFMVTFPYAQLPWKMFLYIVLPFEFTMLVLKMIMGSRVPGHNTN